MLGYYQNKPRLLKSTHLWLKFRN